MQNGGVLSVVKSVQRGTFLMLGGTASGTQTVTSVNAAKSHINFLGCKTSGVGTVSDVGVTMSLTNATTIAFDRGTSGAPVWTSWELIELF